MNALLVADYLGEEKTDAWFIVREMEGKDIYFCEM